MKRARSRDATDERQMATELESCVLAILARGQPCTAYSVRRYLAASLSSYWSASAGAIYPLLRRLEQRGWIRVEERRWGTRVRRAFSLNRSGRHRLRAWLSAPVSEWAIGYTYDPVRTRVFFLDAMPASARTAFVRDAIAKTQAIVSTHRQELKALQAGLPAFEAMGRQGAIAELEARLRWLRTIERRLGHVGHRRRP